VVSVSQVETGDKPGDSNGAERRRYVRHNRRIAVSFIMEGNEYIAQTVDVSKTGALFLSAEAPSPGTRLLLNLSDRHNPELSLHIKATVVRVLPGVKGEKRFAVEFGDALARDPRRLRMFLERVLNISMGLIRVVEGVPGQEKVYAFSFETIHREGAERVKALQASLFANFEEMDEADAILANFGKFLDEPVQERSDGADGQGHTDGGSTRSTGIESPQSGGTAPQAPQGGSGHTETVRGTGIEFPQSGGTAPPQAPQGGGDNLRRTGIESPQSGGTAPQAPQGGEPIQEISLEEAFARVEPSVEPEQKSEAPVAEADAPGAVKLVTAELPVVTSSHGPSFLSRLASLFGGGKKEPKGESLIQAGPMPNVVAGNLEMPVVCKIGSIRFQAVATRLYCAGLKCTTGDKLPQLYANVVVLIPLAGAKRISQIELNGDITRVKPNKSDTEFGGVFEIRISMRTDKMHLELYRTLLEKLVSSSQQQA